MMMTSSSKKCLSKVEAPKVVQQINDEYDFMVSARLVEGLGFKLYIES